MTERITKQRATIVIVTSTLCLLSLFFLSFSPRPKIVHITNKVTIPNNRKLCSPDTFNEGNWVHQDVILENNSTKALENAVGYHCQYPFAHHCFSRNNENGEYERNKAIIDYSWMPEDCTLLPFRSHEVAAHLAANPLLLVGDSITQLMFESFACLLGEDLTGQSQDTNITAGDTSMWVSQLVHQTKQEDSQAITIALIRSDYLVRLDDFHLLKPSENAGYLIGDGSNFPWVHAIPRFTYIVLNTAAHWHPDLKWGPNKDRKELLAAYSVAMKKVYDYLKKNTASHQHIWIRSSPYGHAKCSQYTAPSDMPVAPTRKEGEYEWDMFPEFDLVWKKWIEKDKHPRFHYLDVSMTNHRGDAHSRPDNDCLHTCLPGPVDDWNKLLYHEMAKLIEK